MRRFLLCFFLFTSLLSTSLYAQLANGSIAPDFTVTDIEGNVFNLYEKLDEGKIVILDVFATWCGPCWNYAQKGELEKIWEKYGPSGTDEVFIFYIESDPITTIEDIRGNGNFTFGDYTENISFPVFNSASINNSYHISNYPTVYMICPNKRTTETGQLTLSHVTELISNSCSYPTGINNAELLFMESNLDPICHEEYYTPSFRIQNTGTNNIHNARFDLLINDILIHEDFFWEGMIQPFATSKINFPPVNLNNQEDNQIEIVLQKINEEVDTTPADNSISANKRSPKAFTEKINVEIHTDAFGYEVYWEIRDENGTAIAHGGNDLVEPGQTQDPNILQNNPNGYYHSDTLYTHEVFLPYIGCYEFYIIDDYKDGICCKYGDGFFRLKDHNEKVILEGGQNFYTLHEDFERTSALVSTQQISKENLDIRIFPNPTRAVLNLEIQEITSDKGYFELYNNLGQLVRPASPLRVHTGTSTQTIDVHTLPPGIYWLRIQLGDQFTGRKFIVE